MRVKLPTGVKMWSDLVLPFSGLAGKPGNRRKNETMGLTYPQTILDAAMQLCDGDRMRLVSRLLESLPPEDSALSVEDPDLVEELERRFADGEGTVSWGDLKVLGVT